MRRDGYLIVIMGGRRKEACWHPGQLSQANPSMNSFWAGINTPETGAASFEKKDTHWEVRMKNLSFVLVIAILLAGGAIGAMSAFSQAQVYAPPPPRPVLTPWVGTNTPWVFYKGDWFLNGILYFFFGPKIGFAPYYAYSPVYIVRPNNWYEPRWNTWYQGHPEYWKNFERQYPYWRGHQPGKHYDQNFYNRYHSGQGGGWQKGFNGRALERPRPQGQRPGPAQVTPRVGQRPGSAGGTPPVGQKPGPAQQQIQRAPQPQPQPQPQYQQPQRRNVPPSPGQPETSR